MIGKAYGNGFSEGRGGKVSAAYKHDHGAGWAEESVPLCLIIHHIVQNCTKFLLAADINRYSAWRHEVEPCFGLLPGVCGIGMTPCPLDCVVL